MTCEQKEETAFQLSSPSNIAWTNVGRERSPPTTVTRAWRFSVHAPHFVRVCCAEFRSEWWHCVVLSAYLIQVVTETSVSGKYLC